MNCQSSEGKLRRAEAICTTSVRLSHGQQVFLRPALACLQLGATFYLADVVKPYMLPISVISIFIVAVIALQVLSSIER